MMRLENWSVCYDNPYEPPETSQSFLVGEVYDDSRRENGTQISTSPIDYIDGNIVTTMSGSKYKLGSPNEDYLKFCKEKGCHFPTSDEPIKVHGIKQ